MNKYQKALNEMYAVLNDSNRFHKQKDLLQELINKETPMKPVIIDECEVCKNCGEQGHRCIDFINEHNYCSNCGQRIDWSDEE